MRVSKRTELIVIREPEDVDMTHEQFKVAVHDLIGGQTDLNWLMEYDSFKNSGIAWLVDTNWAFETMVEVGGKDPEKVRAEKRKGAVRLTHNDKPLVCDACGEGWFRKTTYNENIFSCVACNKRYLRMKDKQPKDPKAEKV